MIVKKTLKHSIPRFYR